MGMPMNTAMYEAGIALIAKDDIALAAQGAKKFGNPGTMETYVLGAMKKNDKLTIDTGTGHKMVVTATGSGSFSYDVDGKSAATLDGYDMAKVIMAWKTQDISFERHKLSSKEVFQEATDAIKRRDANPAAREAFEQTVDKASDGDRFTIVTTSKETG